MEARGGRLIERSVQQAKRKVRSRRVKLCNRSFPEGKNAAVRDRDALAAVYVCGSAEKYILLAYLSCVGKRP